MAWENSVFTPLSGEMYTAEWTDAKGNKQSLSYLQLKVTGSSFNKSKSYPTLNFLLNAR
jgi:hypothetical protein